MGGSCANPNTLMKSNLTALVKDKTDKILKISYMGKIPKYFVTLKRLHLSPANPVTLMKSNLTALVKDKTDNIFKYELYGLNT